MVSTWESFEEIISAMRIAFPSSRKNSKRQGSIENDIPRQDFPTIPEDEMSIWLTDNRTRAETKIPTYQAEAGRDELCLYGSSYRWFIFKSLSCWDDIDKDPVRMTIISTHLGARKSASVVRLLISFTAIQQQTCWIEKGGSTNQFSFNSIMSLKISFLFGLNYCIRDIYKKSFQ